MSGKGKSRIKRAGVSVIRVGRVVEAAITNRRVLGPAEAKIMFSAGIILLLLSSIAILWPRLLAIPFAVLGLWLAFALILRSYRSRRRRGRLSGKDETP
jgi:cardiolipin synthase